MRSGCGRMHASELTQRLALALSVIATSVLHAAAPPDSAPAWQGRTVVTSGDVAPAVATSVDAFGRTIVAWVDVAAASQVPPHPIAVRALWGDGFGWRPLTVGILARPAIARLDVETRGLTYVAYHDAGSAGDEGDDRIRLTRIVGSSTVFAEALPELAASSDFDLALPLVPGAQTAWIALRDPVADSVHLMVRSGAGAWTTSPIPLLGTQPRGLSLSDTDTAGRLWLAYTSVVDGSRGLRFAEFDGSLWTTTTLRASGVAAGDVKLARSVQSVTQPGVLFRFEEGGEHGIELIARSSNGVWRSAELDRGTISSSPPLATALGFDDFDQAWLALFRRSDTAAASPYLRAQIGVLPNLLLPPQFSEFAQTPGAAPIPRDDQGAVAAVLSGGYATAVMQRPLHADLDVYRWLPDWTRRLAIAGESGVRPQAGAAITRDGRGRPRIALAFQSVVVQLAWDEGGNWSRSTIAGNASSVSAVDLAIGFDGLEHAVFRQGALDLVYAWRQPGQEVWNQQLLARGAGVGLGADAQLHVSRDGLVFVTHADLSQRQPVVHVGRPGQAFARFVDPDPNAPPIDILGGRVRATLYDTALSDGTPARRLVLAFVPDIPFPLGIRTLELESLGSETPRVSARNVTLPNLIEGGENFQRPEPRIDVAMLAGGRVALAGVQSSPSGGRRLRLFSFDALAPIGPTAADADSGFVPRSIDTDVIELRLGVRNGAWQGARVLARMRDPDNLALDPLLRFARERPDSTNFGGMNAQAGAIDFDARAEELALWWDPELGGNALVLASLNSVREGLRIDPVPTQGSAIDSDAPIWVADCECIQRFGAICAGGPICMYLNFLDGNCPFINLNAQAKAGLPAIELGEQLRAHFRRSRAGRYYLELWGEHGAEIMALTRDTPSLYWQRATTFDSFAPALRALVEGRGDEYRFTPELVAQARAVWEGWAAAGSPALRADIESELQRLDQLDVFAGMTFDQWFAALSVGTAGTMGFADGFESSPVARQEQAR
jgi:hypothetical protein